MLKGNGMNKKEKKKMTLHFNSGTVRRQESRIEVVKSKVRQLNLGMSKYIEKKVGAETFFYKNNTFMGISFCSTLNRQYKLKNF